MTKTHSQLVTEKSVWEVDCVTSWLDSFWHYVDGANAKLRLSDICAGAEMSHLLEPKCGGLCSSTVRF